MADLNFSQPERRNIAVPLLLALGLLAIVAFFLFRFTPHTTAEIAVTHVDLLPTHTVFKSETNVVGSDQVQDDLYAFVTLRITDRLRLPLFLKDFTATLVPSDGSLQPATSAIEKGDLANLYTSFPQLKKLAAAQTAPLLLRESQVRPGQTVEGYLILHLPVTADTWNTRTDAILTVDLYHQQSLTVSLPKSAVAPAPAHR